MYSLELSKVCHLAKNLYNLANWYIRQDFFNFNNFLSYYDLDFILKHKQAYQNLPSQTSQQILKLINKNWKSYFKALREYKQDFKKFKKKPKIPGYKKKNGESIVIFTNQQCKIKDGYLYFPKRVNLELIKTRITENLKEVRIIPLGIKYKIELVYEKEEINLGLDKTHILSIDLGLNNLITAVNNNGCKPFIIKGGIVKSINQYYNKQLAYFRSIENKKGNFQDTTRMKKLHLLRNNKINTIFHRISKNIIKYCIQNDIGITCYSPLSQGLLTGKFLSPDEVPVGRARTRHFSGKRPMARHEEGGAESETFATIKAIQHIAKEINIPMANISLAWLLAQRGVISIIVGARDPKQVRETVQAADLKLSSDVVAKLTEITEELKQKLGPNADMYQSESRIR